MTLVCPPGYPHILALLEIAETLHYALEELGYDSIVTDKLDEPGRQHILLGANLLTKFNMERPKPDSIIYNFEQIDNSSAWIDAAYLDLLKTHEVWDYSQRNIALLCQKGILNIHHVPVGHVAQLERIRFSAAEDIDVLFYGSINERRQQVIDHLRAAGLNVQVVFGLYGAERDALIGRSKIVLNVHFYESKIFEIARVSYLLSNGVCVVSESGLDPAENAFSDAVAFAPYESLVSTCVALAADADKRTLLRARGRELMRQMPQTTYLARRLGRPESGPRQNVPDAPSGMQAASLAAEHGNASQAGLPARHNSNDRATDPRFEIIPAGAEQVIPGLIATGQLDAALQQIIEQANAIALDPLLIGEAMGIEWLDTACQQAGAYALQHLPMALAQMPAAAFDVIYIVTMLAPYGGHTRVIEDFIQAQPGKRQLVLFTGLFGDDSCQYGMQRIQALGLMAARVPSGTWSHKLAFLQAHLKASPDAEVFLFGHPQDALPIAAVQPGLNRRVSYYHHCDHQYTLGVYLPFARHLDPHPMVYHQCRHILQVPGQFYAPMAVADQGVRPQGFLQHGMLTTATSGTYYKFNQPYMYSYFDLLPGILAASGGRHIHIGDLPQAQLDDIQRRLVQAGIDPLRFVHIPWTPSLWQTIVAEKVDLYLQSFPVGGGRATVEILGSGTPCVFHEHAAFPYLNTRFMAPSQAFNWRQPTALFHYLRGIDTAHLEEQSRLSRAFYERYYRPEKLADFLAQEHPEQDIPPISDQRADPFDRYRFLKSRFTVLVQTASHDTVTEQARLHQQQMDALKRQYEEQSRAEQDEYVQQLAAAEQAYTQQIQDIRDQVEKLSRS